MGQTQRDLEEAERADLRAYDHYQQAKSHMLQGAKVYAVAEQEVRRQLIRAFIARLRVDVDDEHVTLASPWREIDETAMHVRYLRQTNQDHASWTYMHSRSYAGSAARARSKTNPDLLQGRGSNKDPLVELLGRYSKRTSWTNLLSQVRQSRQSGRPAVPPRHGIVRRLSDEQVAMLVGRYVDGATIKDLAKYFKIHRTTVSMHLLRQGVRDRRRT